MPQPPITKIGLKITCLKNIQISKGPINELSPVAFIWETLPWNTQDRDNWKCVGQSQVWNYSQSSKAPMKTDTSIRYILPTCFLVDLWSSLLGHVIANLEKTWNRGVFNSLAPGRPRRHFKTAILLIGIFTSSKDNALRWMLRDLTDDKSTLVQVMAWCHQATSHYLIQCWPKYLPPYGVTRPQWVNSLCLCDAIWPHRCVNNGSCNGLLLDSTNPMPEPMLTHHQQGPATFSWRQFHRKYIRHHLIKLAW